MAESKPFVLLVEDTALLASLYREYLKDEPIAVRHVATGGAALAIVEQRAPQAILLDLHLPDMNGLDILRRVSERCLPSAVVVITGHGSIQIAVEAMRAGAYDFLVKPFTAERLRVTLRNALEHQRLRQLVETFRHDFGRDRYCGFIGGSLPMQAVYRIVDAAAASKATVFITGESGTGKEVCAEAIHRQSPRRDKPFVTVNCGAIPKDLMESEIFGHVKGAFTGAVSDRDGAATLARGGTLFLDEICDLDVGLQTKLLRFVQTGTFQRVGAAKTQSIDLRFVCATNRDPWTEVQERRFREDLYYRLHVIPIHLPPLRERGDDVLAIADALLAQYAKEEGKPFAGFAPEIRESLRRYRWPGNVRQLQNVIRNIVVLHHGETVTPDMLPAPLDQFVRDGNGAAGSLAAAPGGVESMPENGEIQPLWQVEKRAIEQAIARCEGSIPKAAAHLRISPSTIYRKRLAWRPAVDDGAPRGPTARDPHP
jgi:DNA-binding NtrC family response regulator